MREELVIPIITKNQRVLYKDKNVTISGNIGSHANVSVTDGTLRVHGSIEENVCIEVTPTPQEIPFPPDIRASNNGKISLENCMHNDVLISTQGTSCVSSDWRNVSIEVDGDVGNSAIITCPGNVTIKGNIGENAKISSIAGDVFVGDVNTAARIETIYGSIKCGTVRANAQICSERGKVTLYCMNSTAQISSGKGTFYVDGIKRLDMNTRLRVTIIPFQHTVSVNGVTVSDTHARHVYGDSEIPAQDPGQALIKPKPYSNFGWLLLSGFIAAIGIAAVAVALTVLHGAALAAVVTVGTIAAGIGIYGLFANSCQHSTSPDPATKNFTMV